MKASSIIKILTCLLCLFIVGAALDSLPDPPAIKPLSIQKNSTFQLAHIPVSTSAKPGFDCVSYRLQLHVNFISAIQSLDFAAFFAEPFVFQAADASPPHRS